jgi:hypothetical protein
MNTVSLWIMPKMGETLPSPSFGWLRQVLSLLARQEKETLMYKKL